MLSERFPTEIAALRASYDAMGHPYHNWSHIQAMLSDFQRLHKAFADPDAVELAIYFHDVVYVPGSKTNETDSADHMLRQMSGLVDDGLLAKARSLVLATATHSIAQVPGDHAADCALLLDMDLAVLGAQPDLFEAYDAAIRTEFAAVPWDIYRPGRRAILKGFLERDRLYLTDPFHATHEAQARTNLSRLLERLS